VRYNVFKARLMRMNPKFRIIPNAGMAWGLFLKQPRHPDANEQGLVHVLSIPSPRFYSDNLPKETIKNEKGHILVRGWAVVVRLLLAKQLVKRHSVITNFRHDWELA
jgi:hypothetical protein